MHADEFEGGPRAPAILWVLGFLFLILAAALTPGLLISLGPMRNSLTSANELTRHTAETTVLLGRIVCGTLALAFLGAANFYRRMARSGLARVIAAHEPLESPRHEVAVKSRFNASFRVMLAVVILGVVYVLAGPAIPYETRAWIQSEDGLIEQGTALIFLGCSMAAVLLAVKFLRSRGKPGANRSMGRRAAWLFALALFFFFCFGEEISWGQRFIGWETPESLKRVNVQDETNVHNLFGYLADHLFTAGVLVYGVVLPLVTARSGGWRRAIDWVGLTMASRGLAWGFLLVVCLQDWMVFRWIPNSTGLRVAELRELLTSVGFALLIREAWLLIPAGEPVRSNGV